MNTVFIRFISISHILEGVIKLIYRWLTFIHIVFIVTITTFLQSFAQQDRIPLNAQGFEIKDSLANKICMYRKNLQTFEDYRKDAVYDTLGRLFSISESWLTQKKRKWVTERVVTTTFTSEGDTASVSERTQLGSSARLLFREDGELFAEVLLNNGHFSEGWQLNLNGARVQMSEFRLIPRIAELETFYKYLAKNMKFPKEARRKGWQGVVYIVFEIDSEGSLTDLYVANPENVEAVFQEEALRLVKSYPLVFEPEEDRNGKPKDGTLWLPIRFVL